MIPVQLSKDLSEIITPFFNVVDEREHIIHEALGTDSPDIRELSFSGSSEGFISAMVEMLHDKEAFPGRNALVAIVSTIRQKATADEAVELLKLQKQLEDELEEYVDESLPNTVFISHATVNDDIAAKIASDLENAGMVIWIDNDRLKGGHDWRSEIFDGLRTAESVVVVMTLDSIKSIWVQREVQSALLLGKNVYPVQLEPVYKEMLEFEVMRSLTGVQFIDFSNQDTYEDAFKKLLTDMRHFDALNNPFKGLQTFEAVDAPIFFGREQDNEIVREQVINNQHNRLSVITGASGTGKSSIMRAGVASALLLGSSNYDERFADWKYSVLRLTGNPFTALAQALHKYLPSDDVATIQATLESSDNALETYANKILQNHDLSTKYVLFIDQFEELFRLGDKEEYSLKILDLLYNAITQANGRVYIVLTIRSDFFARLIEHEGINDILNKGGHLRTISHMSRKNLLETIRKPADKVRLTYESGLENSILDDATSNAGTLPLLQYALQELYQKRDGNRLTTASYEKIGGLKQALARHAESVYLALDNREKRLLRRMMIDLVTINDDGIITRVRRNRDSLKLDDWEYEEVVLLIDYLLSHKARILTMSRINQIEEKAIVMVELAHEALLEEWKRLNEWVNESRELLAQRETYQRLADNWLSNGRQPADFLREANLVRAVEWIQLSETQPYLNDIIREYVLRSLYYESTLWDEASRDVDLLIGSQFEYLQTIVATLQDSSILTSVFKDFMTESTLAETNPYHINVILWTRDEDATALNIALEPAQQWIEDPQNLEYLNKDYRRFFSDAFSIRATEWEKNNRSRDYLLKRHEIDRMRYISESVKQDWYITPLFNDYVGASEAQQKRTQRIQALVTIVILFLGLGATYFAYVANQREQSAQVARQDAEEQRNIAIEQEQLAVSRQLAVQSQLALVDGDLEQAFTLGIESYQVADTADSLSSLLRSLQASPQLNRYIFNADNEIRSLAVHDNQSDVVLGLSNSDLLFYNLETHTLSHTIASTHDGAVWDMVYINAGSQLLTVGSDGWVKLWDTQTYDLLQEIVRDEVGSMYAIAQNPVSGLLAFGGDDGIIYLWDGISEAVTSVPAHSDTIYALDFSSDGLSFASASADRTISLWDTNNFEEAQASLEAHTNWVLDVAFSPDNTLIVASGADNLITVWDVASSELLTTLDNHNGWVRDLEFVDNQQFISASEDKTLILWDMQNLPQVTAISRPMLGHQEGIFDIALFNTGSLLSVSNDGYLIEWFANPQIALGQAMTAIDGRIYDTDLNDQGNILASAVDAQIIITDMGTGLPIQDPIMLEGIASSLVFAPNSTEFVVGLDNGATQIWDVATRRLINEVNNQGQAIYRAIYDSDGYQLASAGEGAVISLQNLETNSTQTLSGHEDRINALAFSPDGTRIASAGHDEQIRLWDTATGELLATFERIHNRPIEALVFSPDGLILYSAGRDTQILIWDVESQSLLASLSEHSNTVSTLALNQTGAYLVSGGLDGDVILWNTATQTSIGRYISNSDDVVDLEFTPEQLSIVASYISGHTIIWDVNVVTWQLNACNSIRQEQQSVCE